MHSISKGKTNKKTAVKVWILLKHDSLTEGYWGHCYSYRSLKMLMKVVIGWGNIFHIVTSPLKSHVLSLFTFVKCSVGLISRAITNGVK